MQSDTSWLKEANMTGHPFCFHVFFCGFKLPHFSCWPWYWQVYGFGQYTCSRSPVYGPLFAHGLVLNLCVLLLYLPLCPTLYCTTLFLLIVLPLGQAGEFGAAAHRKSCIALKEKQTTRCTNTGSATFLFQPQAERATLCFSLLNLV